MKVTTIPNDTKSRLGLNSGMTTDLRNSNTYTYICIYIYTYIYIVDKEYLLYHYAVGLKQPVKTILDNLVIRIACYKTIPTLRRLGLITATIGAHTYRSAGRSKVVTVL